MKINRISFGKRILFNYTDYPEAINTCIHVAIGWIYVYTHTQIYVYKRASTSPCIYLTCVCYIHTECLHVSVTALCRVVFSLNVLFKGSHNLSVWPWAKNAVITALLEKNT